MARPAALFVTLMIAFGALVEAAAVASPAEARRDRIRSQLDWERSVHGLAPLRRSPALDAAAQDRAERMAALGQPMGLLEQLSAAGYEAEAAELVKMLGGGTPERKVSNLLEGSADFRDLVLTEVLTEVGIGVADQAGRSLDLLIFARSRAEAFTEQTEHLADIQAVRAKLLEWTNWAREEYGPARALSPDSCLDRVAQDYAERMLEGGFLGHVSPTGSTPMQRVRAAGCAARAVAENLASGPVDAVDTVAGWLESAPHRRALLSRDYEQVGFGVAFGEGPHGYQVIWVQMFGGG